MVAPLVEETAERVELDKHPGGELGEAFGGKEDDALGGGGALDGVGENTAALAMLVWRDDPICLEDGEGEAKGVAADLELGGEGALSGEFVVKVAGGNHVLNDLSGLVGEGLTIRDS